MTKTNIKNHPAFLEYWGKKKKEKKQEKTASYCDDIEKTAARAWKSRLGQIGEEGIDKLVSSGVLNRDKELKGLRKGSQMIMAKENTKMLRKPEHAAGYGTRAAKESVKRSQGTDLSPEDISATKNMLKTIGPFGQPNAHYPGRMNSIAHVRKNAYPKIKKDLNTQLSDLGVNMKKDGLVGIPRKDKESKKWTQAILERHEVDETRFGRKALTNKRTAVNNELHGHRPLTNFASHLTPKVVAAESANVAVAPKNTRKVFEKMRRVGESFNGYENTEVGALKNISNGTIDYGKSGNYHKQGAKKAERAIANSNRPLLEQEYKNFQDEEMRQLKEKARIAVRGE